ncbi:hypothetical protein B0H67DRAFT_90175 [Lasiosphaeris hirsuta]|uniref:NACHT domain-containing protein n=1 Tax=Lasiosphaeris hirsuta TaxID=260670 RepID=A0AA40BCT8_9PEZI|nr:hypothetical protein B0H67DRAFT_90175 [Lasiosphaeris hirsuta]
MNFDRGFSWGRRVKSTSATHGEFGLHTVVSKAPDAIDCVDVVAIHGLNGHYLNTWTDEKSGVNWLKDILPQVVQSARVMSFSYNSMLQFSKSTSDIFTFGQQLLESLIAERNTIVETQRPIIFICHSLGGLVFKQAFVRVDESNRYMTLRKSFSAVLFFGTPHRGSDIAAWATFAARLLALASLGRNTNAQLSKDLEPGSRKMQLITSSFLEKCARHKLEIASCYETHKMGFLSTLVVDRDSAVLGIPNKEVEIPMESDHRSICRFSHLSEPRFQPIAARLRFFVKAAMRQNSSLIPSLMQSLETSNYKAQRSLNPDPVKGTCTWILDHPKYQSWLEATGPPLLWISADPGCGKSVLASFIIDTFASMSKTTGLNVCYFFFKSDNTEQGSVVNGVKALLHQLYTQQMDLAATGLAHLQGNDLENVEKLWEVFAMSAERGSAKKTVCILDGLDECEPKSLRLLLGCISAFLTAKTNGRAPSPKNTTAQSSGLKILVTSRPDNQIKVAFERQPRSQSEKPLRVTTLRLRGEDQPDEISSDVTKVIMSSIEDLVERGLPAKLLERVQSELIARADRTFLWVALILRLLEQKVEAGASRRELDQVLKTRDIYDIYSQLLASSPDSPRARKMLNIILAAMQALTLEQMSIALAVVPETSILGRSPTATPPSPSMLTFDEVEEDISFPLENHVKSLCGHFVRIIRNKLYLVHETAREFLLVSRELQMIPRPLPDRPARGFGGEDGSAGTTLVLDSALTSTTADTEDEPFQHSFSLLEARALLLQICTTYLYCLAKSSGSSEKGQPSAVTEPFLQYAAKSWVGHFHQVQHRLHSKDLRYFQNLCHPLFPGFSVWIREFWLPRLPDHPGGLPLDAIQDYYVNMFELDLAQLDDQEAGDADINTEDTDDEEGTRQYGPKQRRGDPESYIPIDDLALLPREMYSSNPESLLRSNFFPLQVDQAGLISLDFSNSRGPSILSRGHV